MFLQKNGYYTNRHSCFLLQYHMVLVTKYRHPVIYGDLESALKEYIYKYFEDRDLNLISLECMPDHIHILFDAKPNMNLAEFVNAFKSASSRMVRKKFFKELESYYWKPYFWSLSYFLGTDVFTSDVDKKVIYSTVSDRTAAAVKAYIQSQKD